MKSIVTLLLFLLALQVNAQLKIAKNLSTTNHFQTHLLTTVDGDEFVGRTISLDSGRVTFQLYKANEIILEFKQVDSIGLLPFDKLKRVYKSEFAERTSLMPTAFPLEKGAVDYHNEMLFLNTVNYGVRNNFTVGLGFFTMPDYTYYNVHLKFTQPLGKSLHLALGSMMSNGLIDEGYYFDGRKYVSRFIAPFGALTAGTRHNFANISLGRMFYYEDGFAESAEWIYSLNGAVRATKRLRLCLEVGNSSEEYSSRFFNIGFGFYGKRSLLNFGLLFGEDIENFFPSFAYSRRL
jgi:hypothetical protein